MCICKNCTVSVNDWIANHQAATNVEFESWVVIDDVIVLGKSQGSKQKTGANEGTDLNQQTNAEFFFFFCCCCRHRRRRL